MNSERFLSGHELGWESVGERLERQILGYDEVIMMVRVRFVPGAIGARHHHPHRQVTYVESGRFEVEISGEKRTLEAGDGFIVPPNAEHGVVALESGSLIDVFTPSREDFLQS